MRQKNSSGHRKNLLQHAVIENRDRDRNRKRDRGILPCPSEITLLYVTFGNATNGSHNGGRVNRLMFCATKMFCAVICDVFKGNYILIPDPDFL